MVKFIHRVVRSIKVRENIYKTSSKWPAQSMSQTRSVPSLSLSLAEVSGPRLPEEPGLQRLRRSGWLLRDRHQMSFLLPFFFNLNFLIIKNFWPTVQFVGSVSQPESGPGPQQWKH